MLIRNVKPSLPSISDIDTELQDILSSGQLTNFGKYSKAFESAIQEYLGVRYCLCVSSATIGLMMLLNTVPPGSEVIVPSFTFLPTVQALTWNGIEPVFADINPDTYCISVESIRGLITKKTKAILCVNPFGNPCEIDRLEALANSYDIKLFFDSAHAFGSKYQSLHVGGYGNAEVFSFSATKLLPCGEGGAITTNDGDLYYALLDRRNYGFKYKEFNCKNMGINGKMSEFSAILGIAGINKVEAEIKRRNEIALIYKRLLAQEPGIGFQEVNHFNRSSYKDFTITVSNRIYSYEKFDILRKYKEAGIEVLSYFSPCIHQMNLYKKYATNKLFVTEDIESMIFSLPIYSSLRDDEISYIASTTKAILNQFIYSTANSKFSYIEN